MGGVYTYPGLHATVPPPPSGPWSSQDDGDSRPGKSSGSEPRDRHLAGQGCYFACQPPAGPRGLLLEVFFNSEKDWGTPPNFGPEGFESLHEVHPLPHVEHQGRASGNFPRRLVHLGRLEGRIFSCPDCTTALAFSPLCISGQAFSVQGSPVRPLSVPTCVHSVHGRGLVSSAGQRVEDPALFGRLARLCAHRSSSCCRHAHLARSHGPIGSLCELAEEQPDSVSAGNLSRYHDGLSLHDCSPIASACREHSADAACLSSRSGGPLCSLSPSAGEADSCRYCSAPRAAVSATTADVAQQPEAGSFSCVTPSQEIAGVPSMPRVTGSVARGRIHDKGSSAGFAAIPLGSCLYRRVHHRMGGLVAATDRSGDMVSTREEAPHQRSGVEGCAPRAAALPPDPAGKACPGAVGQHVGCFSHQPSRGNTVFDATEADPGASDLGSPSFCQPEGDPHPGGAECSCRHPIPGASTTGGVEAPPGCSGNYLGEVRESSRRFVRFPRDDTLPAVVLPVGQCQSPRSGCAVARLAEGTPLRLPATSPDRPNTPEGPSGGTSAPSGGPPVAREDLVSDAAQALLQLSDASSLQEGPAVTAGRSDPASQSQSPPTLGLATTGPGVSFSEYGGDIGHTMTNARAPSTRLVYAHKWKAFSRWCQERNEDPVHCPVSVILTFLQALLSQGRSPSTLKVYVAAISCWHSVVSGETVGRNKDVSLFLRGARRLHPPTRPVVPVWDLSIVLAALRSPPYEPLAGASLECVSKKTAFLLAMASAKRVSELHALSVHESCCRWNPAGSGVTLWPNAAFLPKVASPASHTGPLQLARLDTDGPDELLCPVRALKTYVSLTASLRQADNLFVCYAGPRKGQALSKQRLARWIVDVVEQAYIQRGLQPPAGVRCHSTRGVSVSWAAMTGLTLEAICSAASWSSPNTFARFYRVNLATPHPMQGILSQRTPSSQ